MAYRPWGSAKKMLVDGFEGSIFLRLGVELDGNREREVEVSELMTFFFEGVFAGVGSARSAEDRELLCVEVRGSEGSISKGETREAADCCERAAFLGEVFAFPGLEGERVLLGVPDLADALE